MEYFSTAPSLKVITASRTPICNVFRPTKLDLDILNHITLFELSFGFAFSHVLHIDKRSLGMTLKEIVRLKSLNGTATNIYNVFIIHGKSSLTIVCSSSIIKY